MSNVIQVHPATMLGWYDHDRNKNNGMTVHLPLVLKAYFKCIEIKVCEGKTLESYILYRS